MSNAQEEQVSIIRRDWEALQRTIEGLMDTQLSPKQEIEALEEQFKTRGSPASEQNEVRS